MRCATPGVLESDVKFVQPDTRVFSREHPPTELTSRSFFPIPQEGGSGTSRHRGALKFLSPAGAMSGFAGPSGLDRMPSIPTDALLDADDLMQLDDALNFEVDEALAFAPPGVSIPLVGEGLADVGIQPISAARPGPSGRGTSAGFTMGSTGSDHGGNSSDDPSFTFDDLDPSDPKHKRRIQNRMASARFRAKAKERQNELDKLKAQVAQLRREKRDLEMLNVKVREDAAAEAERQRASTMAWIVDHFWLRRKVHFKTLANSVRWMVSGKYRPGMSNAVAELMAKQTADRSADADASGLPREEMEADQDLSGFGDDDAPAGSADPSYAAAMSAGSPAGPAGEALDASVDDGDPSHASEANQPTFGQRIKMFLTDSFKKRMERFGGKDADEALARPHTR